MSKQYYVIGDPVAHSLSPAIYNRLFELYRMADSKYGTRRVAREALGAFLDGLKAESVRGFNITMPLKDAVLPYLATRDESVVYGANTVVVEEDGLHGYSTDADGFRKSLELNGKTYEGSSVAFIGCGSAAKALIRDCLEHHPRSVAILNRTASKAGAFADSPLVQTGTLEDISSHMAGCDILVNATPMGMHGVDADFADLGFLSELPKDALVADLIYNPPKTPFLLEAERTGHRTMNGLWMLIWQAFYAFEKYTGILPDLEAFRILEKELSPVR